MAQAGSIECVYFCMASLVWLVANEDNFGYSRHSLFRSCPLCDRLWWCWVCPTLVPLLWHIWFSLATSSGLDWFFDGGCTQSLRSFRSFHSFSWWSPCSVVLSVTCLACLCLGCVEWEKPLSLSEFGELSASAIGKSQVVFIPVVEDD
jgi:hypothetical protein